MMLLGGLCWGGLVACGGCEEGPASTGQPSVTQAGSLTTAVRGQPPAAGAEVDSVTGTFPGAGTGGPYPGPAVTAIRREPAVRVRVLGQMASVELVAKTAGDTPGAVRVAGPRGGDLVSKVYQYQTPLRIERTRGEDGQWAWKMTEATGRTVRWALPELLVECDEGGVIQLGDKAYPRRLVLVPRTGEAGGVAGRETGRFDVVNHVPMETYLAGVIERELYGSWPLETFKAQAVAARSYAAWEQTIASDRHFDLESTTASQAYIGQASNPKAVQAVADTRGEFLTYLGRVVPAFYSSSTGGTGQDAVLAFPNRIENLPPLRGREHGAWDKDSPQWRWGPVQRDTAELARRLAAWGRDRPHPVAELSQLRQVEVAGRNAVGRPSAYRVTGIDQRGRSATYLLAAESFRVASNDTDDGRLPVDTGQRLLSSHLDVAVAGRFTTITGRGYGHGVGMSQWGARTMGQAGHDYRGILQFYYPGAAVVKLY